jgi:tetratricopeptide (TPR) repeat protein
MKAECLIDNRKFEKAIKVINDVFDLSDDNVIFDILVLRAQFGLGIVQLRQGKYDKALDNNNDVLEGLGDLGDGFNPLEKLLKPLTLNNKALALKHLNRNEEALECLNQAITANPHNVDMLINLGSVLHNMKQY